MKVEFDMPALSEFEYTGERRTPKEGEWFLAQNDTVVKCDKDIYSKRLILKKKRWRAKAGGTYYSVDIDINVISHMEQFHSDDDENYATWNYFRTFEEAEAAWERVLKALKDEK